MTDPRTDELPVVDVDDPDELDGAEVAGGMDEETRARLAALRAAQRMPLAQRRGMLALRALDDSPVAVDTLRPGKGLGALLRPVPAPRTPERVVERVVEVIAAPAEQPAAQRVELEWLLARDEPGRLHHAALDAHALTALARDQYVSAAPGTALPLSCGAIVGRVSLPGVDDQELTARCAGCCAALSYPVGTGSPLVDPACRATLAGHVQTAGGLT